MSNDARQREMDDLRIALAEKESEMLRLVHKKNSLAALALMPVVEVMRKRYEELKEKSSVQVAISESEGQEAAEPTIQRGKRTYTDAQAQQAYRWAFPNHGEVKKTHREIATALWPAAPWDPSIKKRVSRAIEAGRRATSRHNRPSSDPNR